VSQELVCVIAAVLCAILPTLCTLLSPSPRMSWIWNPSGNAPKPQPTEEMVPDPGDPNRMVSKKVANQPFLVYHEYKLEQQRLHQTWLERKKEREEKLARGEKVGPEERDPTAEEEVGLLGLLKFIVYLLLVITLAGKFFTGSFLWEYDGKWARLKTYWPVIALCPSSRCCHILTSWLWYRNLVAAYFRNPTSAPLTGRIQASRYTSRLMGMSMMFQVIDELTALEVHTTAWLVLMRQDPLGPGVSRPTVHTTCAD
jgi:hypothetical protein